MSGPDDKQIESDDTEGHRYVYATDGAVPDVDDDVSGHVQPPPDWQQLDR